MDGSQATSTRDLLRFEVLLGGNNNTVISNSFALPGSWTGNMAFTNGSFSYVGTGAGDVQFVITTGSYVMGPPSVVYDK